jgi:O-antigen ligase
MAVFGAVGIGRDLAGPGLPTARSPVFWAVPLLWLLGLASVIWSPAPMVSFIAFSTFSLLALGFIVFAAGRGIFRTLIPLVPGVYLVLALLGGWAVVQYLFFPDLLVHKQVRVPFGNPNNYAALLMIGLFPALGVGLSASNRKVEWTMLAAAMLLAAGIGVIGGRAVTLLSLIGLAAMAYFCRGMLRKKMHHIVLVVLAGVAAFSLQFVRPQGATHGLNHAGALATMEDASAQSRVALWDATGAMIEDHPWRGTGFGTFYLFYPQYRQAGDTASAGLMAHNDLLQFWAEMGAIAPLLLLVLYIGAVCRTACVLRRRGPESGERAICVSLFLACGLAGLDALVNFDLYSAPTLALLGMMLGLWFRYTGLVLADRLAPVALPASAPRMAGWALAVLPLLAMVFVAQGFLRSEHYADKAQAALLSENFTGFQTEVDRARAVSFDRSARPYMLAAAIPMGVLMNKDAKLSPGAKAEMLKRADSLLSSAERRNARLVAVYYDRAVMARYGMTDKKDKGVEQARRWLEQALAVNPGHVPSRLMLADIENQEGHTRKALDILKDGLDQAPLGYNAGDLYSMTATLALKEGDEDAQKDALLKLQSWQARGHVHDAASNDTAPVPFE